MERNGILDQWRGTRPIGEKCPCTAAVSGCQVNRSASLCDLCALLRLHTCRPSHPRRSSTVAPHGLRIALVDDDEGTHLAAREMVQAQRDGWTLEAHHPSCRTLDPSRLADASHRSAAKADCTSRPPPDIVLVGLRGPDLSRLACVRKLKGLSPGLPMMIISECRDTAVSGRSKGTGSGRKWSLLDDSRFPTLRR